MAPHADEAGSFSQQKKLGANWLVSDGLRHLPYTYLQLTSFVITSVHLKNLHIMHHICTECTIWALVWSKPSSSSMMPKPTKDTRKLPSPAVSIAFLAFLPNFAVFCPKDFLLCNFYASRKICTMPSDGVVINQDLEKMVNTARLGIFIFSRGWDDDGRLVFLSIQGLVAADSRHLPPWIPTRTPEWPRNDRRQILNVNRLYWSASQVYKW